MSNDENKKWKSDADAELSYGERALSAGGAAFLSAIIVNPLDVAKTRLQAQAAGVPYNHATCRMLSFQTNTMVQDYRCPSSGCNRYKGTLDVLYKVIRHASKLLSSLH